MTRHFAGLRAGVRVGSRPQPGRRTTCTKDSVPVDAQLLKETQLQVVKGAPAYGSLASISGFAEAAGPKAMILVDESLGIYRAIGQLKPMGMHQQLSFKTLARGQRSWNELKTQTTDGEGVLAGGGIILDKAGQVVFAWKETKGLGELPPLKQLAKELARVA